MTDIVHITISLKREKVEQIKALVDKGIYPTISGAFDAAADAVLQEDTSTSDVVATKGGIA